MIAIDLGSNSFRCISYDCEREEFGESFERIVKTADQMHITGQISEGAIRRVIDAIKAADKALHFKAHALRAVTTQAMRMASNAEEVLQRIKEETGVVFEIISSDDEARYTLLAVETRLKTLGIESEHFVLIDVGGGSTEIIFSRRGSVESKSFPVGIVTTAQICEDGQNIDRYLHEAFGEIISYVSSYYQRVSKPGAFVATAGTPTTMAAYLLGMDYSNYDVEKINGYQLSIADTQKALDGLMILDEAARAKIVGVGRESLILAGIVIVQKLYEVLGFDEATVIDDGVREGVAIDFCQNHS